MSAPRSDDRNEKGTPMAAESASLPPLLKPTKRRTSRSLVLCGLIGIIVVILTGAVLSSLQRGDAERTYQRYCADHLKMIGLSCMMYANDFHGAWPPDFAALRDTKYLDTEKFFACPANSFAAPGNPDNTPAGFAARQYQGYAYFGAGRNSDDITPKTILAADQPGNHPGLFMVLLGDGRVAKYKGANLKEIARQNGLTLPSRAKTP